MSRSRIKLLTAFALVLIAISIFGRAAASREFSPLFGGAAGGRSSGGVRRANVSFQTPEGTKPKQRAQFTIYRNAEGEIVCRRATEEEIRERESLNPNAQGLRRINHLELIGGAAQPESIQGTGLTIILRATQQLQQNAAATAAFTRAAQNWEAIVTSPITIFIDVDFGPTNFGQTWPSGVLGATAVPSQGYPYQSVRTNLIAEANGEGSATTQAIFNSLPATTVPTDLGDGSGTDVADANGRAIGLLPATAQSTDGAARIGFNSNSSFDFDPSDGITAGQTDFDAVATHEIGHALGLSSDAGTNLPRPSVWDFFRFRTGATPGTFTNAQRIMTIGGSPDPLQFFFVPGNSELGLSNGGPAGSTSNGADGWQSSHWKHVNGCVAPIGIMDPAIPSGCRRTISANDQLALSSFGYNFTNNNAPPPPPPPPSPPANDNFANAQTISGCSGTTTGVSFGATSEAGEPSHDPTDGTSLSPSRSVWYQWQAPLSGSTTMTTAGSDYDTILAVYTGSSVGSLTRVVFNDDVQNGIIQTSTVTFPAAAGTTYQIVVDGLGRDSGRIQLNWNNCGTCSTSLAVDNSQDLSDVSPGDGICASTGGGCTLRAAIQEANALTTCGVLDINLITAPSPISLTAALPPINHNVSIRGPVADHLTIQRSLTGAISDFRIFTINSGRSVTISDLTLSNGRMTQGDCTTNLNDGSAINNAGTLTMTNVNLYGNTSRCGRGALFSNGPTLVLNSCNIGGTQPGQSNIDGGGVFSVSSLTMTGGSVVGNTGVGLTLANGTNLLNGVMITNNAGVAFDGGGIETRAFGSTTIFNCVIANNIAVRDGGGIYNGGDLKVINTTISGNTSGGDGAGIDGTFQHTTLLTNVTISNNRADSDGTGGEQGGGLHVGQGPPVVLNNCLVAGNFRGSAPSTTADDIPGTSGFSGSFNLIGTGGSGGLNNGVNGNKVGVSSLGLSALAFNGGPTMTHALLAGSPAINAGSNALAVDQNSNALTTDQRGTGFSRVVNGTVDIGAFEAQSINQIDQPDFFVKQHYLDFLNRTADQSGLDFWTNQITSCGSDPQCIEVKRINVSAAFFLSIEFQQTGNLVYKMYKAGFGNLQEKPVAVDRAPFIADTRQIQSTPAQVIVGQGNWQAQLETNKQAFALAFVQRSLFQTQHAGQNATDYVNSLFTNAGVTNPDPSEVSNAIAAFNSAGGGDAGRAAALRNVCESNSVHNKLFNEAFVLMQYFGYLQRNPYDPPESTLDYQGYNFWLGKLNSFGGDYLKAEMVKGFIASDEYRHRFGP